MKIIKILGIIILSIIGIILSFILIIKILGCRTNIANGITGTEIKQIEVGMSFEEVISILGTPFEIENIEGQHNLVSCKNPKFLKMSVNKNTDIIQIVDSFFNDIYCCDSYKESIQKRSVNVTLIYTKRFCLLKSLFISYPMLWIHLDTNYCVWNVYAKKYDFIDDVCIYSLSWKTDATTCEETSSEIDLIINDELFNECFRSKKQ